MHHAPRTTTTTTLVEEALAVGRPAVAAHLGVAFLLLEPVVVRQLLASLDVGARKEGQVHALSAHLNHLWRSAAQGASREGANRSKQVGGDWAMIQKP